MIPAIIAAKMKNGQILILSATAPETIDAVAQNEQVMAVKVNVANENLYFKIEGLPHITIATNPEMGGKPTMSNEFAEQDFQSIDPIQVCGKVEEVMR